MRYFLILSAFLCLVDCSAEAVDPPSVSTLTETAKITEYKGDWGRLWAKMINGIFPEDFRKFYDRDPERVIPSEPNIIVSPADGIVLTINDDGETKTLIVSLGFGDVHVQRIPISGKVRTIETAGHGQLPVADMHYLNNVQVVTTIDTAVGPFVVKQITGIWTTRIKNYIAVGQEVLLGARMGRILLGSTVTLTVPKRVRFVVQQYDRVIGGQTIIGRY